MKKSPTKLSSVLDWIKKMKTAEGVSESLPQTIQHVVGPSEKTEQLADGASGFFLKTHLSFMLALRFCIG